MWASSLEAMRQLNAKYLVPSHTRPVVGEAIVNETFTIYRDAILFVHDQTVRLMNMGYFVDDIVAAVKLPPHLFDHPYLQVNLIVYYYYLIDIKEVLILFLEFYSIIFSGVLWHCSVERSWCV